MESPFSLPDASILQRHRDIPLGFTPCNACPVEFPESSGTPLGIQQGGHISLGLYHSSKRFPKSSTGSELVELFLWLFCKMTLGVKQEKQNNSQTET